MISKTYILKENNCESEVNLMGEKPIAALVLSLIGGFLGLFVGVATAVGWMIPGAGFAFWVGIYWTANAIVILIAAFMMYTSRTSINRSSLIVIILSIFGTNILALTGGILANKWEQFISGTLKIALILGMGMFVFVLVVGFGGAFLQRISVTPAGMLNGVWWASLLGSVTLTFVFMFAWLIPRYLGLKK
jgi:hypothetical protein